MIPRSELAAVIGERTLHISDTKKLATAVAGYLLEQNRLGDVESLMRDVLVYRAQHGHVEATAVSAYPLTSAVRSALLAELKHEYPGGKSYTLNERLDAALVGGVRLEMAGEELDLSVRDKLNRFKRLTAAREN
jgi:F-type H+-transporting ATPase subunit delta